MDLPSHRFLAAALIFPAVMAALSAQTTTTDSSSSSSSDDDETMTLDAMEVTGSRIRSLAGEQPAMPVITLDALELEHRGVTRIADIRWAIPQLGSSVGFNDNLQNGGPSRAQQESTSFDLRGLGANATLVLIDGRRIPRSGQAFPGGAGGREDFNIDGIPISAIERVEVLPVGAGAIYGSDAIAGVVNIVLKKHYTGAELKLTYDNTFDTDAANMTASLTAGYHSGRFSTFITLSASRQNALATVDRDFGLLGTASTYTPYEGATLSTEYYPEHPYGNGNLDGFSTNVVALPAGTSGTDYTLADLGSVPLGSHYNSGYYSNLIDPTKSRSVVLRNTYAITDTMEAYFDVNWAKTTFNYTGAPLSLTVSLPANYLGNPFSKQVYLSKVFYDIRPHTDSSQQNVGLTGGVRGTIGSDWQYDLGLSWSRNTVSDKATDSGFNYTALYGALGEKDAAKQINLTYDSRTVPDPNGDALQALLAYRNHKDTSDLYDALFSANGPIWKGWAGDFRMAAGAELQREEQNFFDDPLLGYELTGVHSRTISAGFAELAVPLLSKVQNIPFVYRLEVQGAARYEDFSDIGNHLTPSVSAVFSPVSWFTLRASRTEGFKAPKLYDLASPNYTTQGTISASRHVIDTARGGEAVNSSAGNTFQLTSGGQPNLKPETSVSRDIGVVVDVPWVEGLSFSVDWWDTLFKDKVGTTSYQTLIDYFPERVIRGTKLASDPAEWLGPITGFDTSALNLSWVKAQGVDATVTYRRKTGWGDLLLTGTYSNPQPQTTKATPASTEGKTYTPDRFAASFFWSKGPWEAGVSATYQAPYEINGPAYPQYTYPSYTEWDPRVAYTWSKGGGDSFWSKLLDNSKLSVTIINAFNTGPSDEAAANNRVTMDPRLRRYVLSLTKKF